MALGGAGSSEVRLFLEINLGLTAGPGWSFNVCGLTTGPAQLVLGFLLPDHLTPADVALGPRESGPGFGGLRVGYCESLDILSVSSMQYNPFCIFGHSRHYTLARLG